MGGLLAQEDEATVEIAKANEPRTGSAFGRGPHFMVIDLAITP